MGLQISAEQTLYELMEKEQEAARSRGMFGAHPAGREDFRGGEEEEERAEGEEGEEALNGVSLHSDILFLWLQLLFQKSHSFPFSSFSVSNERRGGRFKNFYQMKQS